MEGGASNNRKHLTKMHAMAASRMLPLRASIQRVGNARLSGMHRYRQRASRLMLQRRVPAVSTGLMDIGLVVSMRFDAEWHDLDAELQATPKFRPAQHPDCATQPLAAHMLVWAKHGGVWSGLQGYLRRLCAIKSRLDAGHRVLPLFVMLVSQQGGGHSLAVVVHYNDAATEITAIDWLNLWNDEHERVTEVAMTWLARTLSHTLMYHPGAGELTPGQSVADIMARIRLPLAGCYNLQEGEMPGYCQSWDSYMVHKVMAQRLDPCRVFAYLERLSPRRRQQKVVDFTNKLWRMFESMLLTQ